MEPPPSTRTRLVRERQRGRYDRATIDAILDEGLVAHLAFVSEGQPFAIPTLHARVGDVVYVHGSSASRTLRAVAGGIPACLTVTLLDGVVLARSVFEHSINYRSVMLLGTLTAVTAEPEKRDALRAFTEQLIPGRWAEARQPSAKELRATSILALPITEASAKVRDGGPEDGEGADADLPVWAGHIPLRLEFGAPVADPALRDGIPLSGAATAMVSAAAAALHSRPA